MLFTRTIKDKIADVIETIDSALFELTAALQDEPTNELHELDERLDFYTEARSEAIARFQTADDEVIALQKRRNELIEETSHPSVTETADMAVEGLLTEYDFNSPPL